MRRYLLIETKGAWTGTGCARFWDDALALTKAGHDVFLTLLADGVTAAIRGVVPALTALPPGCVWAEQLSLRSRGVLAAALAPEVRIIEMTAIAHRVLEPDMTVVWH